MLSRDLRDEERPRVVSAITAEYVIDVGLDHHWNAHIIEDMHEAVRPGYCIGFAPRKEDILPEVLEAVREGDLVAFKEEQTPPPRWYRKEEPIAKPPPPEEPTPGTFDLQVVLDGDGSGVRQLSLGVKTKGEGEFRALRTDASGSIHIQYVGRGVADVRSDIKGTRLDQSAVVVGWGTQPILASGVAVAEDSSQIRYLVELEEYRVRDGDTTKSVAARARMSWPDLAYFNWGTRMPEEINKRLASEVGCTKKGADGNCVFSADDRPGIIHIPRPFSESGLVTGKLNVVRVKPLRRTGHIRISLGIDPRQAAVRHQRFRLFSEDGAFEQEKGVEDDLIKSDERLDFEFTECPVDRSYSLEIVQAGTGPVRIFEGASFEELHDNHEEDGAQA